MTEIEKRLDHVDDYVYDIAVEAVHETLDALEPIIQLAIQHDRSAAEHHLRKLGLVGGSDNFAPIEKMLLCGCAGGCS